MPLQIRRGTDAERLAMTQPLAQGELLFVSTPGAERLYIGNGSTLGGIQITGYTNADAKDAAAAAFTGGTHSGITFTYNTATDLISANVDLSNYQGILRGDLKGSVFADDSTMLVDAVSGTIVGPVTGNITGNVTGNVIGNVTGNVIGDTTGYHTGDVKGSVFADDSTLLVDAVSGTISATSITGNIFTNLIDSANSSAITFTPSVIFNSDVTVENELFANLVGNVTGNIQGNVLSSTGSPIIDIGNETFNGASVNIENNGTLSVDGSLFLLGDYFNFITDNIDPTVPAINFVSTHTASAGTSAIGLLRTRGSFLSPGSVLNGDDVSSIVSLAHEGNVYVPVSSIRTVVDGAVSAGAVPGRIEISTANSAGVSAVRATVKSSVVEFAVPPKLPVVANDTARTTLVPTPSTGMMIFMTAGTSPAATNKVQVYDSTAWVNLH